MSRVITFSRQFPSYHPRAGEPTYFVEKIWNGLPIQIGYKLICDLNPRVHTDILWAFWKSIDYSYESDSMTHKYHTIRAGNRWKVGDWFSPRVWSGKPYNSKMIQFAPDIEVKKTWTFDIINGQIFINGRRYCLVSELDKEKVETLAANDGLNGQDLLDWFRYPKPCLENQIICWSDSITY